MSYREFFQEQWFVQQPHKYPPGWATQAGLIAALLSFLSDRHADTPGIIGEFKHDIDKECKFLIWWLTSINLTRYNLANPIR
jgi:hypothetical protein